MKTPRIALKFLFILLPFLARTVTGQTPTYLWQFTGGSSGSNPSALIQGSDGNFYGTTYQGGTNNTPCGTVFRISPGGSLTFLYDFCSQPDFADGTLPKTALLQGSDGNFYGTTSRGEVSNFGGVFRISPSGDFTNLSSFTTNSGGIGFYGPYSPLVQGSDGNFYGGALGSGTNNYGQLFRVTPSGGLTTLYSFSLYDGAYPFTSLVPGTDGGLYGITYLGGNTNLNGGLGFGTVFRLSPSGTLTTLYSFAGGSDGFQPSALVQGSDGNFYGTTYQGGNTNLFNGAGCGTVFRIGPTGSLTTLYSFTGGSNGFQPNALMQGSDGNFYGTTYGLGGSHGTLFCIHPNGSFTNLYTFTGPIGGVNPTGLVQGSDGSFYGTTTQGGTDTSGGEDHYGTVFRFTVPLNPPPNQIDGIQLLNVFGNSYIAVLIPSVAGEIYQLQYSDSMNPTNWFNVGDSLISIGGPLTLFDLVGGMPPQRFYRFDITP